MPQSTTAGAAATHAVQRVTGGAAATDAVRDVMGGAAATDAVRSVTDATFAAEVLASPLPVLVDFTADWCPPCRMIAPVLADIAAERGGELKVASLNVDENPETQAAYGVLAMPTLMLFRAGEPVRTLVGARPKRRLLNELADVL